MRIEMEAFEEGTEIIRVYLALKVEEATAVERTLDAAGVEYGIEVEDIVLPNGLGLKTTRSAAGFWIREPALDAAEAALVAAKLEKGLVLR
ncbi:MAG: hypothetical protein U0229_18070 [Anaeromyxobacter sp.]